MHLAEVYHCIFPSGEQCRATFHVSPKEVVYSIRWLNVERAYGSLQKEADQWIEGCVRQLRKEYGQTQSVLMDLATLETHRQWAVKLPQIYVESGLLNPQERSALKRLCTEGLRLEQERVPFTAVVEALKESNATNRGDIAVK